MSTEPTIHRHLEPAALDRALREDVRAGLTASPKTLPPKWFYDERGSKLFDEITRLVEYYPTRTERAILTAHAAEIAEVSGAETLVELGAHLMPRARRASALGLDGKDGPDDLEMFPCVDLGEHELLLKFWSAGLFPAVRDITSELGIPTFFAAVCDDSITGFPMAHCGLGAHPNAEVAVRRALLELAQSRCVDIQAVREDIPPPGATFDRFAPHSRRVNAINRESWYHGRSKSLRKFRDIHSYPFATLEEDLDFLLERFAACGLDKVIVVDFTPDKIEYSVVRVIVPGIENWALDHGRLGHRALSFWKRHA